MARRPLRGRVAGVEGHTALRLAAFWVTGNLPIPEGGFALGDTLALGLLVIGSAEE